MVSRTLVKLIDQAIVPAIVLLCTRAISVVAVAYYLGINVAIGSGGFIFPTTTDYVKVNSYSLFLMMLVLFVGLVYVLLKALVFHDTHISPSLTAKLFTMRLSTFIQNSYDLYSQGAVWLSYSFLVMLICGVFAYTGLVYSWVFYVSLVMSVVSAVILVFDVENELFASKNRDVYREDDTIIDIEEEIDETA